MERRSIIPFIVELEYIAEKAPYGYKWRHTGRKTDYHPVICALCKIGIDLGEFVTGRLTSFTCGNRVYWRRRKAHEECVTRRQPEPPNTTIIEYEKVHKSAFIYLIMLELGLPGELAWAVAAGACWLLQDPVCEDYDWAC
jgi:hypothetical protein